MIMFKNLSSKKSQALSLNTIVIAALVVLVLIILAAILMGRFGIFTGHLEDCPADCKGERGPGGLTVCPEGYESIPGHCEDEDKVCCAPIGEIDDDGLDTRPVRSDG